ncbi:AmmeMemoRadiSam system protein A [Methylomonas sp. AM2-LC]|uniref:AmmeMemoRadiSam system protein A n=1 Tax=Methylomonas sp. AM2-LC TaxID=3153301 RepID=UPI003264DA9C
MPLSLIKTHAQQLLCLARDAISYGLKTGNKLQINLHDYPVEFAQPRATFVTLHCHQELRGCIGRLQATRPLALDVVENAYAAAFCDRRFPPLEEHEFNDLDLHISLLSSPEKIDFVSEQDLINQLRPHIDGLILELGSRQATFLPSVWESLANGQEFLQHLKLKAGLDMDFWSDNICAYRYSVESIPNSGEEHGTE